jgi:tetratricopeptide (TPR) repeat protein
LSKTVILLAACLGCSSCDRLGGYERDIRSADKAVAAAATDAERAAALSRRGRAYGEKARYARTMKLLPLDEYLRVFDLAIADHDRAIALAAPDPALYLDRGLTYYDRGEPMPPDGWETAAEVARFQAISEADFSRAVELDPKLELAYDRRGIIRFSRQEFDLALRDFETVGELDPRLGKIRLADTYCARAGVAQKKGLVEAAIGDYQKSIDQDVPGDGCDCDPYGPLAWLYLDAKRDYANSWRIVHAAKGKGYIEPEFVERLKRESGLQN